MNRKIALLVSFAVCLQCGGLAGRIKSGKPIEQPTNCDAPLTCLTGDYSVNGQVVAAWVEADGHDSIERTLTDKSGFVNEHFGAMFEIDGNPGVFIFYPSLRRHEVIRSDFVNYLHIINRSEFEKKYGKMLSQSEFYPRLVNGDYLDASLYAYAQALDRAHWHKFLKAAPEIAKAPLIDQSLIPEAIPYFQSARKYILNHLSKDYLWGEGFSLGRKEKFIAQDWEFNIKLLRQLRRAASRAATLPEILAALKVSKSLFFTDFDRRTTWSIEGASFGHGALADALRTKVSRELYALALRAQAHGHKHTAAAANLAQGRLSTPLGIDIDLHTLLADTAKNSMSPAGVFRMKFNTYENLVTLDQAAAHYAVAPVRARLKGNVSNAQTAKRYYQTIEYHKPTAGEKAKQSEFFQTEFLLQMQLAEIEKRMSAINSGGAAGQDTRAVTGYRCDSGTGLNCRPTYQGGGESASAYYSRMNRSQQSQNLAAERDRIVQQLATLRNTPPVSTYDQVTKSQDVNRQSARVTIEIQQGNGEWQSKAYTSKAHSIEGRQGVGYGMDKRTLYYYVMSNVASDIVRDLADLAQKAPPPPLPLTERAAAEPWDKAVETCLAGKAEDIPSLLECIAQTHASGGLPTRSSP